MNDRSVRLLAWGISDTSLILAFVVWFSSLGWDFSKINSYTIFPLFGLAAFSLMWSHYIVGAKRRYFGKEKSLLNNYFKSTSLIVLICILAHPAILMTQLYLDGYGYPPQSYLENYIAPSLAWAAGLGSISLIIFLLFELHRKFKDKKWWKYIDYAQLAAMAFIFIHGLALGRHVQSGWFKYVWIFYGVSFVVAVVYNFQHDRSKDRKS